MKDFYEELIQVVKENKPDKRRLARLKKDLCKKYKLKEMPKDTEIFFNLNEDVDLKPYLSIKPTRTISGVAPISLMTKPEKCKHGTCVFCPGGPNSVFGNVPQSYTGNEPASRRALRNNYDPYLQIFNRLQQYTAIEQSFDKIEIIIQGGTFLSYEDDYKEEFITYVFKALNDFSDLFYSNIKKFKEFFELPGDFQDDERVKRVQDKVLQLKGKSNLLYEQKRNETSKARCVGLTVETKPDWGKLEEGNEMLSLGTTRVELGVQSVYDDVLLKSNRGHTIKDTIESIRILRDLGFKLNFHYMPGLFVDKERDLEGMKELFSNPDFRPDMLKIYPCRIFKGTALYNMWKSGKYKPLSNEEAVELISEFKRYVPEYCRIMRVNRDIPDYLSEEGVNKTNLREDIKMILSEKGIKCRCIRCRESGRASKIEDVEIVVREYEASGGKEFFISAEDVKNDVLLGFCRLRFPSQFLRKEITKKSALIRELHVYSKAVSIGHKEEEAMQHKGYGRILMEKAEEIARSNGKDKAVVISGVGVKKYFIDKLNYKYDGPYVSKEL